MQKIYYFNIKNQNESQAYQRKNLQTYKFVMLIFIFVYIMKQHTIMPNKILKSDLNSLLSQEITISLFFGLLSYTFDVTYLNTINWLDVLIFL